MAEKHMGKRIGWTFRFPGYAIISHVDKVEGDEHNYQQQTQVELNSLRQQFYLNKCVTIQVKCVWFWVECVQTVYTGYVYGMPACTTCTSLCTLREYHISIYI